MQKLSGAYIHLRILKNAGLLSCLTIKVAVVQGQNTATVKLKKTNKKTNQQKHLE